MDYEAAEIAGARATLFRALASYFLSAPSPGGPLPLGDESAREGLRALYPDDALGRALRELDTRTPDPALLRDEYHALFVVPGPLNVAPIASAHLDVRAAPDRSRRRGLLAGPSAQAVKHFYHQAGFVFDGIAELPDHIGIELAFMALLCEQEQRAWADDRRADADCLADHQSRFLAEHLAPFVAELCDALDARRPSPTYRAVSALLRAVVRADQDRPRLYSTP